ncbi:Hypothetical protein NTJ_09206 [Nesidiocoris tenuis]|uniref:Uncharacterized protein n=1 Tax=Nesidiocoris tenuis TaxID=355587 RepID=A0ABN7AW46_9HEMI|nr:Hypothetical protein NTJ_09206 [Nesidiocoris tenuis]
MGRAWRTDHTSLVYLKGQETTPSRPVRNCRTPSGVPAPTTPLTSVVPMPTQAVRRFGAAEAQQLAKSLRQDRDGTALELDRLHVLKIRNREADGRKAMTKDKFSKYSPLPDISRPHGRPLLRQKTYDVLEPVYVKGPAPGSPRQPPISRGLTNAKDRPPPPKTAERGKTANAYRTNKDTALAPPPSRGRQTKLPQIGTSTPQVAAPTPQNGAAAPQAAPQVAAPAAQIAAPPPQNAASSKKPLRKPFQFKPQELSKDILPHSPTAFWFPI